MVRIVKTEFYKLKRYHILWAGVALMLLSVLLTLFTSMANDGSVWDFSYLIEQVIKNNMSMIFPMCISLIAGYMISREQTDDTLKNILTVPISFKRLLTGKLIVCGVLSIIFGLICSLFTIIAELLVGFPGFQVTLALKSTLQITAVNFFLYLLISSPLKITEPLYNLTVFVIIPASVLFPQPLSPTSPTQSPSSITSLSISTAIFTSYAFLILLSSNIVLISTLPS